MFALRLKSVSYPNTWAYIWRWTGERLFRSASIEDAQTYRSYEEAEEALESIRSTWAAGMLRSRGLTDERVASIEIYRIP
jgi:hypothetical protein